MSFFKKAELQLMASMLRTAMMPSSRISPSNAIASDLLTQIGNGEVDPDIAITCLEMLKSDATKITIPMIQALRNNPPPAWKDPNNAACQKFYAYLMDRITPKSA